MRIDRKEVERIAALAHLEFDDEGLERMASELSKILDYIDQLREVDVERVTERPLEQTPLREDVLTPSVPTPAVEKNAPSFHHGHFVVPRVIGGEE